MHSQDLLCVDCGSDYREGSYELLPAIPEGLAPAEWVRIIRSQVRQPTAEQRIIRINGVSEMLETDYYNCDVCNAFIRPGDIAVCRTIWMPIDGPAPHSWEHQFMFI